MVTSRQAHEGRVADGADEAVDGTGREALCEGSRRCGAEHGGRCGDGPWQSVRFMSAFSRAPHHEHCEPYVSKYEILFSVCHRRAKTGRRRNVLGKLVVTVHKTNGFGTPIELNAGTQPEH